MKYNKDLENNFIDYFEELAVYDWQRAQELLSRLEEINAK